MTDTTHAVTEPHAARSVCGRRRETRVRLAGWRGDERIDCGSCLRILSARRQAGRSCDGTNIECVVPPKVYPLRVVVGECSGLVPWDQRRCGDCATA